MNMHVRIWQALTDMIAQLLPDYTVTREYNAVAKYSELTPSNATPKAFVTLENKGRERITSEAIFDVYVFQLWIVEYLPDIQTMDERLGLLDTIADAFSMKRITLTDDEGAIVVIADEETETLGGNPFDLDDLLDSNLFSVKFSITLKLGRHA